MPIMINTKDIGKMDKDRQMVFISIPMEISIPDSGKMTLNMDMECSKWLLGISIKEIGSWERKMV